MTQDTFKREGEGEFNTKRLSLLKKKIPITLEMYSHEHALSQLFFFDCPIPFIYFIS